MSSSTFGVPPICPECGEPVEQLDAMHGKYRQVHSWCVNRRRERRRRGRAGDTQAEATAAPQDAKQGRANRPAYSICRNCGRQIPPPPHGPMRTYCDRRCQNEYRRALQAEEREITQRGRRQTALAIADMRERTARMRAQTAEARRRLQADQAAIAVMDAVMDAEGIDGDY